MLTPRHDSKPEETLVWKMKLIKFNSSSNLKQLFSFFFLRTKQKFSSRFFPWNCKHVPITPINQSFIKQGGRNKLKNNLKQIQRSGAVQDFSFHFDELIFQANGKLAFTQI